MVDFEDELDPVVLWRCKLSENISKILPHLNDNTSDEVAEFLIESGVQNEKDLQRVTTLLLKEKLNALDSSCLYADWQEKYGEKSLFMSGVLADQEATSSKVSPARQKRPLHTSSQMQDKQPLTKKLKDAATKVNCAMPVFDKDSPFMPSKVREAIIEGKRPAIKDRREMVARIVDHCRDAVPNLSRNMFNTVADSLVTMYPNSFKDTLTVNGIGSESLRFQMKTKFDNDKRPKMLSSKEKAAPALKEAVGCIVWNPPMPENETNETLSEKKAQLREIFGQSKKDWDFKIIKKLMEATFYSQRNDINRLTQKAKKINKQNQENQEIDEPADPSIFYEWPFLTQSESLNVHFIKLTGIDFREKLRTYLSEEADTLLDYLASKNEEVARVRRKMQRAKKRGYPHAHLAGILLALIKTFQESKEALFSYVEETTSFETAKQIDTLPKDHIPHLIVAGKDAFAASKLYVAVDDQVVGGTDSLFDATCLLFCFYFVFNIEYSSKLATTLTFIQRATADINPAHGNKCKSCLIHRKADAKVRKLGNKIAIFKQQLEEEENEDPL